MGTRMGKLTSENGNTWSRGLKHGFQWLKTTWLRLDIPWQPVSDTYCGLLIDQATVPNVRHGCRRQPLLE